ncbi:general odorant-binding protein 19d-like [Macrosteles quadrilineatus]|uniref:general odorant-binding protein 19d-like n=1 Tax=Macrosteles quadrilineatus TaxID=74068 RepID=UPI0023E33CCD|nr:general odorant-binding protein 19d-like [Macrosteles quadrilineatus]
MVVCGVNMLVLVVIAAVVLSVAAQQPFDVQKMYKECQRESNATDEELSAFQKSQSIPTTQHGKCLLACIFQNTGVMTSDGKYNVDGVFNLAKQSYMKSPEKLAKARKVVDICAEQVKSAEDECEVAVIVANCTMTTSMKLGLESA